jgi:diguanylate cyclase (GGDEF)-like protein
MNPFIHWYFGAARIRETQLLTEFRYRFLLVLIGIGGVSSLAYLAYFAASAYLFTAATGTASGPTAPPEYMRSLRMFAIASILLWMALRGRPHLLVPVAWGYAMAGLMANASALVYLPSDELRILWLFSSLPIVYLLLGQFAGGLLAALTAVSLLALNPSLAAPYSEPALATAVISMIFLAAFLHASVGQMLNLFVRLRTLALRDPLTGTLHTQAYHALAARQISAGRRHGSPFALLTIDLDRFRTVNETWGHEIGNEVLQAVAACVEVGIREGDIVGRIGGEEFAVFLPETHLAGAVALAERLRHAIEVLMPAVGGQALLVTASIGVAARADGAQAGEGTACLRQLEREAGLALAEAKREGRNRVAVFGVGALRGESLQQSLPSRPARPIPAA